MMAVDEHRKWTSVFSRDPQADGHFVYAVKTTRCFCRPTCKARLPRRSNVEFFDTPAQAQAAGYRACKRCQPLLPSYTPELDKIRKACNLLDALPNDAALPSLDRLSEEAGLTKYHFHRLFKRATGVTPRQYALCRRSKATNEPSISQIAIFQPAPICDEELRTLDVVEEELSFVFDPSWDIFDEMPIPSLGDPSDNGATTPETSDSLSIGLPVCVAPADLMLKPCNL